MANDALSISPQWSYGQLGSALCCGSFIKSRIKDRGLQSSIAFASGVRSAITMALQITSALGRVGYGQHCHQKASAVHQHARRHRLVRFSFPTHVQTLIRLFPSLSRYSRDPGAIIEHGRDMETVWLFKSLHAICLHSPFQTRLYRLEQSSLEPPFQDLRGSTESCWHLNAEVEKKSIPSKYDLCTTCSLHLILSPTVGRLCLTRFHSRHGFPPPRPKAKSSHTAFSIRLQPIFLSLNRVPDWMGLACKQNRGQGE